MFRHLPRLELDVSHFSVLASWWFQNVSTCQVSQSLHHAQSWLLHWTQIVQPPSRLVMLSTWTSKIDSKSESSEFYLEISSGQGWTLRRLDFRCIAFFAVNADVGSMVQNSKLTSFLLRTISTSVFLSNVNWLLVLWSEMPKSLCRHIIGRAGRSRKSLFETWSLHFTFCHRLYEVGKLDRLC